MKISKIWKTKKATVLIGMITVFLLYNGFWYIAASRTFDPYTVDMESDDFKMDMLFTGKSYSSYEDGVDYHVKYPNYLGYVGNIGMVSSNYNFVMIIWPSVFGEDEYGVRITDGEDTYEIMLNQQMKPMEESYAEIVESNKDEILFLYDKAREKWTLI